MILGISSRLEHTSPQDWAAKHKALGLKCVNFPVDYLAGEDVYMAYKRAADEAGLVIAEVGVWRNTLAADLDERAKWIDYAVNQLRMADQIGAICCVNVVGTPYGPRWDGGYRENYSKELWDMAVRMIQQIIDTAAPKHTKYCIESMPWMIPTGPDDYLRLMEEVGRDRFAVHMDIINMTNSAERYFEAEAFIDRCASLLGDRIRSCHIKDIHLKQEYTIQMAECAPGEGEYPLRYYVEKMNAIDKDMPVILEHLNTDEEYIKYMTYLKEILNGFKSTSHIMYSII